jgi:hypothetical protein
MTGPKGTTSAAFKFPPITLRNSTSLNVRGFSMVRTDLEDSVLFIRLPRSFDMGAVVEEASVEHQLRLLSRRYVVSFTARAIMASVGFSPLFPA